MNTLIIRDTIETDAKAILAIYAPYVEQTAVTFEYNVPSEEEFRRRIDMFLRSRPVKTPMRCIFSAVF